MQRGHRRDLLRDARRQRVTGGAYDVAGDDDEPGVEHGAYRGDSDCQPGGELVEQRLATLPRLARGADGVLRATPPEPVVTRERAYGLGTDQRLQATAQRTAPAPSRGQRRTGHGEVTHLARTTGRAPVEPAAEDDRDADATANPQQHEVVPVGRRTDPVLSDRGEIHVVLQTDRRAEIRLTFLSFVWDFRVFTQVWVVRQGGPNQETVTLPVYMYVKGTDCGFGEGVSDDALRRLAESCLLPGFEGTTAPDWVRRWLADGLGAVALYARNIVSDAQLAELTAQLRAGTPDVVVAIDEEGGDVTRLEAGTGSSYPGHLALGVADDPALTRAVAAALAARLRATGVSLNLAPVADVNTNPGNPVIGTRAFGTDPDQVAEHVAAFVEGLQGRGIGACAKHFPGHGGTAVDSHHGLPRVTDPIERLHEVALPPFRAAIGAGSRCIMTGHLVVTAYDAARPATLSRRILTGLLRDELGFTVVIVTDGLEMEAISHTVGLAEGAVASIAAGADLLCVGGTLADEHAAVLLREALVMAVRERRLPEQRLAESAARVRALAAWGQGAVVNGVSAVITGDGAGPLAAQRALRGSDLPRLAAPPRLPNWRRRSTWRSARRRGGSRFRCRKRCPARPSSGSAESRTT
jgi:beta-N-acetylhexosaminidase